MAQPYKPKGRNTYYFCKSIRGVRKNPVNLGTGNYREAKKLATQLEKQWYKESLNLTKNNSVTFDVLSRHFIKNKRFNSKETKSMYKKVIRNELAKKISGSENTQRLHWRFLSAIYNWGIKHGFVNENPYKEYPKSSIPKVSYYSGEEIQTIFDKLPKNKVGSIIKFAFYTGCRLGEMAHLEPENIFEDKIVLHGKTGMRTIPITNKIRNCLNDDIFNYNENSLRLALSRRGLSATKIRHTFATNLVRNGMSIYAVSKLLGHKSVTTTEKYYAHLAPEEIKNHTDWLDY